MDNNDYPHSGEDKEFRTMRSKTNSLVFSLFALSFTLSLQFAARAQTIFHRAAVSGLYHLGGSPVATGLNVSATSSTNVATGRTIPGGVITLSSGPLLVHTGVASVTFNTITILGVTYKHAMVVGTSYLYNGVMAHAVIEMTRSSPIGEAGFQIVRNSDGAVLIASWPNGFYQQIPLQTGGMSMF